MRIDRRVVRRKDQYLLAIPAQVRKHLGVVAGSRVWWHIAQKGACAVSNTGRVIRGRLKLDADCPSCVGYRAEMARLEAKLQAQPQRIWNQFRTQEAMRRMSLDLTGYPALDAINERLAGIEERLGHPRLPPRAPRRRRLSEVLAPRADEVAARLNAPPDPARKSTRRGAAPHVQSLDPPPPPGVPVEGEAMAPGTAPGHP